MNAVRLAAIDGADRRGGWRPEIDTRMATLESPVASVLEPRRESLAAADRVTLAPDVHYPFHPSTGIVTDPAVIGAIAAWFDRETDADLTVVGRTDERIAFGRTASYLGYGSVLERFDADLVDVADGAVPRRNEYRAADGRSVALSVPDPLLDRPVIAVPTLRPSADGPVAGSMRALASLVNCTSDPTRAAIAATRAIDPELAVLDATIAYGSDPVAANLLASGPAPAVDAVSTSLLGREAGEDDALSALLDAHETSITVENPGEADLSSIRERLSGGQLPPSDDTHPAVSTAYRLYAAASGDAVPPQLEGR
ncbi:DUF362 domain-containing protein [Natronococcus wangiae]|uniref:DUF362 domain-containing protein n=1 Tax=Natronococcus wangiae TaxID=3068275 RepID=UPI00273FEC34|nr:DUF362 domain-containing protein [Natronococcus sp. AD5]